MTNRKRLDRRGGGNIDPRDPREIARRLRLLRTKILRIEPIKKFADMLGEQENTYGTWERRGAISAAAALKICDLVKRGMDLDYIYSGETDSLRLELRQEIEAAEADSVTDDVTRLKRGRPRS